MHSKLRHLGDGQIKFDSLFDLDAKNHAFRLGFTLWQMISYFNEAHGLKQPILVRWLATHVFFAWDTCFKSAHFVQYLYVPRSLSVASFQLTGSISYECASKYVVYSLSKDAAHTFTVLITTNITSHNFQKHWVTCRIVCNLIQILLFRHIHWSFIIRFRSYNRTWWLISYKRNTHIILLRRYLPTGQDELPFAWIFCISKYHFLYYSSTRLWHAESAFGYYKCVFCY